MKFTILALSAATVLATTGTALALPLEARAARTVDPALVPEYGVKPGQNPSNGFCEGAPDAEGNPTTIPCNCPPDRTSFINALNANVAASRIAFPTDASPASQLARLDAAIGTLENMAGGCPVESTTFQEQADALEAQLADAGVAPRAFRVVAKPKPKRAGSKRAGSKRAGSKSTKPDSAKAKVKGPAKPPKVTKPATPTKTAKSPAVTNPRPPLAQKDSCAGLLVSLQECRSKAFFLPFKCEGEQQALEKCQFDAKLEELKEKTARKKQ
ncbi:hypothetical protein C8Q77DRAFT_1156040 [Trametes polyzona]|nr:hypothetical protein C8Q77DRAFT_1156040 [Trametes polyzona]